MIGSVEGWVLDGGSQRVAVAAPELAAVLYRPQVHTIPFAPAGFSGFALWQGRVIAVLDLAAWLGASSGDPDAGEEHPFVGVFRFALKTGAIDYGGIRLATPPLAVAVDDGMACPLPEPNTLWHPVSWSCFSHQGAPVPIVRLPALFRVD